MYQSVPYTPARSLITSNLSASSDRSSTPFPSPLRYPFFTNFEIVGLAAVGRIVIIFVSHFLSLLYLIFESPAKAQDCPPLGAGSISLLHHSDVIHIPAGFYIAASVRVPALQHGRCFPAESFPPCHSCRFPHRCCSRSDIQNGGRFSPRNAMHIPSQARFPRLLFHLQKSAPMRQPFPAQNNLRCFLQYRLICRIMHHNKSHCIPSATKVLVICQLVVSLHHALLVILCQLIPFNQFHQLFRIFRVGRVSRTLKLRAGCLIAARMDDALISL